MNQKQQTPEEIAQEWWNDRPFELKYVDCIKYYGYDKEVGLLTKEQIKHIYTKKHNHE